MGVVLAWLVAAVAVAVEPGAALAPRPPASAEMQRAIGEASCSGEYADAILALSSRAREFERQPEADSSYCLRNTAVYECLSYGADGRVRKRHLTAVAHGTAFAYREKNGETLLLTNDHVATWPAVTDDDHEVAEVPPGCRKIDEQLRLVRDESDDYDPGQVAVSKVVSDPALDAAVLRTRALLNVLPYRTGRSALIKAGNVVEIRGYPLGLLQATNSGTVVSAYDLDRERGWSHVDFVTDALVTRGNSGSPVLAVSCRTGELELVGLYHAGYKGSPALNTVVGIDQLRDLMDNLRPTRPPAAEADAPGRELRAAATALLAGPDAVPFFRVGDRVARVRAGSGATLFYELFGEEFPTRDRVALCLEEGPDGSLVALSGEAGRTSLARLPLATADAEARELALHLHDLVRLQLRDTLAYRAAAAESPSSREAFQRASDLARALAARRPDAVELVRTLSEATCRLAEASRPGEKSELARSVADGAAGLARPPTRSPPAPAAGP